MSIVSPGWREGAVLGMKMLASFGFPAERMSVKKGSRHVSAILLRMGESTKGTGKDGE